jgi:hypothetical protein
VNAARKLIQEVKRHGARLVASPPDKLRVVGKPLPNDLIEQLRAHKLELLALLRKNVRLAILWDADNWRDYFEERAAILEFEEGLKHSDAETRAIEHCIEIACRDHVPEFLALVTEMTSHVTAAQRLQN